MCKYCRLEEVVETGEKLNNNVSITEVKDGHLASIVSLNRYIVEEDDIHRNELIIETGVYLRDDFDGIKSKHIKINYCPFCGEKL